MFTPVSLAIPYRLLKCVFSHTEDKQQTLKRYNPYNLNIFISIYFFLFSEPYPFVKAVFELSN